jgi:hypothetical protein
VELAVVSPGVIFFRLFFGPLELEGHLWSAAFIDWKTYGIPVKGYVTRGKGELGCPIGPEETVVGERKWLVKESHVAARGIWTPWNIHC